MELAQLIAEAGAHWIDWPVERAIFGTTEPAAITVEIERFVREELGASISEPLFFESSVGSVFGLRLGDGREVVIKAHQPDEPRDSLIAVHAVCRHLSNRGFPCPRPVLDPRPLGLGHGTVEELRADGDWADAHDPAVRRKLAELLAVLIELGRDVVDLPGLRPGLLSRIDEGQIWPRPHSAIFDFDATAAGAEWIDELAIRARQALRQPTGQRVVGHDDWSVKHFRFRDGDVTAVYDWDSLALDREPVLVGEAARGFTFTWRIPVRLAPSLDESRAFVAEYETARGAAFTAAERETAGAAAVYALAYTARCEHCLGSRVPGNALDALATHGEGLFAI